VGAAVPSPSLLLEARPAPTLSAEGPDADRALEFARRFAGHHGLAAADAAAHLVVHRGIPAHSGLGSGTQLALAVARALAELRGLPTEVTALARAVGRGRRSAIGTWTFALGGFVLEGGRKGEDGAVAPLLARLPLPGAWRCVVVVPRGKPGLTGEEEAAAFEAGTIGGRAGDRDGMVHEYIEVRRLAAGRPRQPRAMSSGSPISC